MVGPAAGSGVLLPLSPGWRGEVDAGAGVMPSAGRLLLAPLQESAQRGPEPEQLPVFVVGEVGTAVGNGCCHKVYRTTICLVEPRERVRIEELTLGLSPALLGATLLVGHRRRRDRRLATCSRSTSSARLGADALRRRARRSWCSGASGVFVRGDRARARQPGRCRVAGRQHPRFGGATERPLAAIARADVGRHDRRRWSRPAPKRRWSRRAGRWRVGSRAIADGTRSRRGA